MLCCYPRGRCLGALIGCSGCEVGGWTLLILLRSSRKRKLTTWKEWRVRSHMGRASRRVTWWWPCAFLPQTQALHVHCFFGHACCCVPVLVGHGCTQLHNRSACVGVMDACVVNSGRRKNACFDRPSPDSRSPFHACGHPHKRSPGTAMKEAQETRTR